MFSTDNCISLWISGLETNYPLKAHAFIIPGQVSNMTLQKGTSDKRDYSQWNLPANSIKESFWSIFFSSPLTSKPHLVWQVLLFYIGNKISVDLPMSCSTRGFNLVSVLHILKYYFYLYTFKASRRVVRVFFFFWSITKWS